jgi:hypothetical protein
MKTNIFIPNKINVGYQERSGTYTGKLAYVIYWDAKGKLRKETSWNSWRNKEIDNTEFENVPTEGFVLNKKVGGGNDGWNSRNTYARVYDPRGFEFEISIENLLYLLENTSCIKGKGIEGELVYGWDGKELVLIPVESVDYKEISSYSTNLKDKPNLKGKDLTIGGTYLSKGNEEVVYMGRFDYADYADSYYVEKGDKISKKNKKYFFMSVLEKTNWRGEICNLEAYITIGKNILEEITSDCHADYARLHTSLEGNPHYSAYNREADELVPYTLEEFTALFKIKSEGYRGYRFDSSDSVYGCTANNREDYESISINAETKSVYINNEYTTTLEYWYVDANRKVKNDGYGKYWGWNNEKEYIMEGVTQFKSQNIEEIFNTVEPCYKKRYLENGKYWRKENSYESKR